MRKTLPVADTEALTNVLDRTFARKSLQGAWHSEIYNAAFPNCDSYCGQI